MHPLRSRLVRQVTGLLIGLALLVVGIVGPPLRQEWLDTELHRALQEQDVPMTTWLLEQGANPNATYSALAAEAPVHLSVWQVMWDRLLNRRPIEKRTAALLVPFESFTGSYTPEYGALTAVLLQYGANPNVRSASDDGLWCDGTPLFFASVGKDTATVRLLLQHGADPNIADLCGLTPLCFGNADIARELIAHGADVNPHLKASDIVGPLLSACDEQDYERAKVLWDHGASPDKPDRGGRTLDWYMQEAAKSPPRG